MKKYNMPTMEISLFDAEVVSTSNEASAAMENFTEFQGNVGTKGIARTITWKELELIW